MKEAQSKGTSTNSPPQRKDTSESVFSTPQAPQKTSKRGRPSTKKKKPITKLNLVSFLGFSSSKAILVMYHESRSGIARKLDLADAE